MPVEKLNQDTITALHEKQKSRLDTSATRSSLFIGDAGVEIVKKMITDKTWVLDSGENTPEKFFQILQGKMQAQANAYFSGQEQLYLLQEIQQLKFDNEKKFQEIAQCLAKLSKQGQIEIFIPFIEYLPGKIGAFLKVLLEEKENNVYLLLSAKTKEAIKNNHQSDVITKRHAPVSLEMAPPEQILIEAQELVPSKEDEQFLKFSAEQSLILSFLVVCYPFAIKIEWLTKMLTERETGYVISEKTLFSHELQRIIPETINRLISEKLIETNGDSIWLFNSEVLVNASQIKVTVNVGKPLSLIRFIAECVSNTRPENNELYLQLLLSKDTINKDEFELLEKEIPSWSKQGEFVKVSMAVSLLMEYITQNGDENLLEKQIKIARLWKIKIAHITDKNIVSTIDEANEYIKKFPEMKIPVEMKVEFYTELVKIIGAFPKAQIDILSLFYQVQKWSDSDYVIPKNPTEITLFRSSSASKAAQLAKRIRALEEEYEKILQYKPINAEGDTKAHKIYQLVQQEFEGEPLEKWDIAFYTIAKRVKKLDQRGSLSENAKMLKKAKKIVNQIRTDFIFIDFYERFFQTALIYADNLVRSLVLSQAHVEFILKRGYLGTSLLGGVSVQLNIEGGGLIRPEEGVRRLFDTINHFTSIIKFQHNVILLTGAYFFYPRFYEPSDQFIKKCLGTLYEAIEKNEHMAASYCAMIILTFSGYTYDSLAEIYALQLHVISRLHNYLMGRPVLYHLMLPLLHTIRKTKVLMGFEDTPPILNILEEVFLQEIGKHTDDELAKVETVLTNKEYALFQEQDYKSLTGYAKHKILLRLMEQISIADALLAEMEICILTGDIDTGFEIAMKFVQHGFIKMQRPRIEEAQSIRAIAILTALKFENKSRVPLEIRNFLYNGRANSVPNYVFSASVLPEPAKFEARKIIRRPHAYHVLEKSISLAVGILSDGYNDKMRNLVARMMTEVTAGQFVKEKYNPKHFINGLAYAEIFMIISQFKSVSDADKKMLRKAAFQLSQEHHSRFLSRQIFSMDPAVDSFGLQVKAFEEAISDNKPFPLEMVVDSEMKKLFKNFHFLRAKFDGESVLQTIEHLGGDYHSPSRQLIEEGATGYIWGATSEMTLMDKKAALENSFRKILSRCFDYLEKEFHLPKIFQSSEVILFMQNEHDNRWRRLSGNVMGNYGFSSQQKIEDRDIPIQLFASVEPFTLSVFHNPQNYFPGAYYNSILRIHTEKVVFVLRFAEHYLMIPVEHLEEIPTLDVHIIKKIITPEIFAMFGVLIKDILRYEQLISRANSLDTNSDENIQDSRKSLDGISMKTDTSDGMLFENLDIADTLRLENALGSLLTWCKAGTIFEQSPDQLQAAINLLKKFRKVFPSKWNEVKTKYVSVQKFLLAPLIGLDPAKKLKKSHRNMLDILSILTREGLVEIDSDESLLLRLTFLQDPNFFMNNFDLLLMVETHRFIQRAMQGETRNVILSKNDFVTAFGRFSVERWASENLSFYLSVAYCRYCVDHLEKEKVNEALGHIMDIFINSGAEYEINIVDKTMADIKDARRQGDALLLLEKLIEAQSHVKDLLDQDVYFNYLYQLKGRHSDEMSRAASSRSSRFLSQASL